MYAKLTFIATDDEIKKFLTEKLREAAIEIGGDMLKTLGKLDLGNLAETFANMARAGAAAVPPTDIPDAEFETPPRRRRKAHKE